MTTGGTIGLFLGASIMSVVEAGFWIYKVSALRYKCEVNLILIVIVLHYHQGAKRVLRMRVGKSRVRKY